MMGLWQRGALGNFFEQAIALSAQREREERNQAAGIAGNEGGLFGVPDKGIACEFDVLDFKNGFYVAYKAAGYHIFDAAGKLLFVADDYEYLGKDIFLVGKEGEYKALYRDGVKLTEDDFKSLFSTKFEGEFCVLLYKEYSRYCVVNTRGEIVFEAERYQTPYIHNNVVSVNHNYTNLLTGEFICKADYGHTLSTADKELIFLEVETQVWKINTFTGEVEKYGKAPERPKPAPIVKAMLDQEAKKKAEVMPRQGRNELCSCGSGKKFKNCCIEKIKP